MQGKLLWRAAGCLLSALLGSALAQAQTESVVKVWPEGDRWFLQNTSGQNITGFCYHIGGGPMHLNPHTLLINTLPDLREDYPILPGETVEISLKHPTASLEVPAVILGNKVVGSCVTQEGDDVVGYIFDVRRAEFKRYQQLAASLEDANRREAVLAFRRMVCSPSSPPPDAGAEYTGTNIADSRVRWACDNPAADQENSYAQLRNKVGELMEISRGFATRSAQ